MWDISSVKQILVCFRNSITSMISSKLSPETELKLKSMEVKKNLRDVESLLRRQRKKEAENKARMEEEEAITEFIEEFCPASAEVGLIVDKAR